jgi:CoA:oxalate CoA-transferase
MLPCYGPVRTKDGDILIAPVSARNFAALRDLTGLPELSSDPRFTSVPARGANWTAMMQVMEKWTMQHTADECLAVLDRAGIPSARFRDPAEALDDPYLAGRGTFAPVADAAGEFKGVNAPWRMSGSRSAIGREVPSVGSHRDDVLARVLGLSRDDIERAAASGAFGKVASTAAE